MCVIIVRGICIIPLFVGDWTTFKNEKQLKRRKKNLDYPVYTTASQVIEKDKYRGCFFFSSFSYIHQLVGGLIFQAFFSLIT